MLGVSRTSRLKPAKIELQLSISPRPSQSQISERDLPKSLKITEMWLDWRQPGRWPRLVHPRLRKALFCSLFSRYQSHKSNIGNGQS
ncbi:hypothetical protein EON65_58375 [archaeon]|nr:MAG: hypothetical protein EON65_58375 [archaeon]